MDDATHRLVRAVRTGLIASTCFGLAAGAHLSAGGTLPTGIGLVALLTLTLVVAVLLARRPLNAFVVGPVTGGLQLALHHCFMWLTAVPAGTPGTSGVSPMVMPATGHPLGAPDVTTSVAAEHLAASMASMHSPSMLTAHAVGTAVTTVLLVLGDKAARRALLWWSAVLPVVLAVVAGRCADRTTVPPAFRALPVRSLFVLGGGPGRRGPPEFSAPARAGSPAPAPLRARSFAPALA